MFPTLFLISQKNAFLFYNYFSILREYKCIFNLFYNILFYNILLPPNVI